MDPGERAVPNDHRRPWVIVTGASSGIGKAFCDLYAELGYNIVMVARRKAVMEEISAGLAKSYVGFRALILPLDLSEMDAGAHLFASLRPQMMRRSKTQDGRSSK